MYSYIIKDGDRIIDIAECAFRDLPKVIDFYGEKNLTVIIKKVIDVQDKSS